MMEEKACPNWRRMTSIVGDHDVTDGSVDYYDFDWGDPVAYSEEEQDFGCGTDTNCEMQDDCETENPCSDSDIPDCDCDSDQSQENPGYEIVMA